MLKPRQVADVLRYWSALLRHEEALSARPRARRPGQWGRIEPNVKDPVAGQEYLKLPAAGSEAFCIRRSGKLELEPSAEWCAFFEDWLSSRYRNSDAEADSVSQLVAFPAIHLPRDELGGLLRCPVRASWLTDAGRELELPAYRARLTGSTPPLPARLRLSHLPSKEEETLPFFVDGRILRDVMRVESERLDAFFSRLRARDRVSPQDLVVELCQLLGEQIEQEPSSEAASASEPATRAREWPPGSESVLFAELHQLASRRLRQLGAKARAFPVALVMNTSRNRATFHVQKDIDAALALAEEGQLPSGPLHEYLSHARRAPERQPLLGRFSSTRLTSSQRQAAAHALGSTLTAVQGPPGTGKTTLTLNLAAHAVVERVAPLLQGHRLSSGLLVVSSTNNRAVDNVMAPLSHDLPGDRLPLALRVGSREVVDQVTSAQLARAVSWLNRAPEVGSDELKQATEAYRKARGALNESLAPGRRSAYLAAERLRLEAQLQRGAAAAAGGEAGELRRCLSAVAPEARAATCGDRSTVRAALSALSARLRQLSELAEQVPEKSLRAVEAHFRHTQAHQAHRLSQCLSARVVLGLPPSPPPGASEALKGEIWEDAAERALGCILDLRRALAAGSERLDGEGERQQASQRLREIDEELAAGRQRDPPEAVAAGSSEDPQHALHEASFVAACHLREVWARANRTTVVEALSRAQLVARRSGSLRGLLASPKGAGPWLRRLFPVWGCTLLSLGNNFPPELGCLERVVVDEAGQCHGAYAVAALLRAERALVVGDVHQLEPVAGLSSSEERRVLRSLELSTRSETLAPFRMHEGSANSAQSMADIAVSERPTLVDHFRCQPAIAALCERLCGYGLVVHTPPANCSTLAPELCAPVLLAATRGQQVRFAGSWINEAELDATVAWARYLLRRGLEPGDLGIITPYRGQLEHLWRRLAQERIPLERSSGPLPLDDVPTLFGNRCRGVAAGTVHLFQGGERRVILLTTTITERRSLGFLDERVNLINVAASRAREHLLTVGHAETLGAGVHTSTLLAGATQLSPLPPA